MTTLDVPSDYTSAKGRWKCCKNWRLESNFEGFQRVICSVTKGKEEEIGSEMTDSIGVGLMIGKPPIG